MPIRLSKHINQVSFFKDLCIWKLSFDAPAFPYRPTCIVFLMDLTDQLQLTLRNMSSQLQSQFQMQNLHSLFPFREAEKIFLSPEYSINTKQTIENAFYLSALEIPNAQQYSELWKEKNYEIL